MTHKSPALIFACSAFVLIAAHDRISGSPGGAQLVKAYQYTSLKGLSNEKLFEYMGDGPSITAREWAEKNRQAIPEGFWDSSPQDAALALLAATQTTEGKQRYAVTLGKPTGGPPSTGTLVFSDYSDRSYNDIRSHYFVRFSPAGSFFAYAMTLSPGQVGYDVTRAETAYDFRSCELTYAEAKHFAQVIWWLGWAETTEKDAKPDSTTMSFGFSSADGRGHLSLVPEDGGTAIDETGILQAVAPGTWGEEYSREVYLNVAGFAVEGILFERLSKRWEEADADRTTRALRISRGSGDYAPDELARLKDQILLFLKLYSPDGRRISHWHVATAARAAGDLAFTEAAPLLSAIQKNLPPPARAGKKKGRTLEEIRKEIEKLMTATYTDESSDKADELMEEYERVRGQADSGDAIEKELDAAAGTALRKIEAGEDIGKLTKWAKSRDTDATWAASRLLKKSASAYADVLADWLDRARPEYKSQILHAIYRAHPQKALDIAAKVPPGEKSDLSTAAAEILEKSGVLSGNKDRVASLIQVALDKKADWEERNRAIDLLVPRDNPGRFPDKAVDAALIALIESETSKGFMPNFTLTAAARALAWRKRVDQLDKLIGVLEDQDRNSIPVLPEGLLSAVTYLARQGKEAELKKLAQIIAPHFKRTNWRITEILWSAWAADLREFKSDIERIATASTTDEEGRKASQSGGAATEVNERYHLARKIAALWNEKDLLTRGKLLLAFGFSEAYEFVESEALERGEHMKEALAALAREAAPADIKALGEFMTWCDASVIGKEAEPVYRQRMEVFDRLARGILGI